MVRSITLTSSPPKRWRIICDWIAVCAILIGTVAVSHAWLGGSAFVDGFALLVTVLAMLVIGDRQAGKDVVMTPAELCDYVNAGLPADAKEWVKDHRIYASRLQ